MTVLQSYDEVLLRLPPGVHSYWDDGWEIPTGAPGTIIGWKNTCDGRCARVRFLVLAAKQPSEYLRVVLVPERLLEPRMENGLVVHDYPGELLHCFWVATVVIGVVGVVGLAVATWIHYRLNS